MGFNTGATGFATAEEMHKRDAWLNERLLGAQPPFSFLYDRRPSADLLPGWTHQVTTTQLSDDRIQHTLVWTEPMSGNHSPGGGLEIRCEVVNYTSFPVVEWTVHIRNTGEGNTPLLEQIQALDVEIERENNGEFVLHHNRGDYCSPDSYQPFEQTLWHNTSLRFAPLGGRPTNSAFPYYNLGLPGGGLILAIGWPGQWAATFARDAGRGLKIQAGQELTHLYLKPGEEIRTPLMALLFWEGADRARAQNLWRRWMLMHNLPRQEGQPPAPMYTFCSGGFFPNLKCSEAGERMFIDTLHREGIQFDYWWMDAGWYPCDNWPQVGTWEPDPERFPNGLKGVSDYVHATGSRLIVWFEPERVAPGTWLYEQRPEWLLVQEDSPNMPDWARRWRLLNLGNPAARTWLTDHVDRLIREEGIDLYRQDFNIDPLGFWRRSDEPDRQGMTENLYVQGYLAYWDELRRRHPGMLIDSCASGGRRNDLETLRRSVPLLRSDYQSFQGDPTFASGNQGHTYALASWFPYYGQGVYYSPEQYAYSVHSHMCPAFCMAVDVRKEGIDWDLYRHLLAQWREVADFFLGDYYPLTPYSLADDAWIAWQFDRPDLGQGVIQAFRRGAPNDAIIVKPRGLEPDSRYTVTERDRGKTNVSLGSDIMAQGLVVTLPQTTSSALITYGRA